MVRKRSKIRKAKRPTDVRPERQHGVAYDVSNFIPAVEDLDSQRPWIEELYPLDVVMNILRAGAIPDTVSPGELKARLVEYGTLYRVQKRNFDQAARNAEGGEHKFEAIAKTSELLETQIQTLSDTELEDLWLPLVYTGFVPLGTSPGGYPTPDGLTIWVRAVGDNGFQVDHLTPPEILESLHVLGRFARRALTAGSQKPGCRPRDFPFANWVQNAVALWERTTGKTASYGVHANEPITPALAFCLSAFRQIDPHADIASIVTAMRHDFSMSPRHRRKPSAKHLQKPPTPKH